MIKNLKSKFSSEMRFKLRWSSFLSATLLATVVAFVIALPVSADKSDDPATSVKNDIKITINEKVVKMKTTPFLDQGVVYLPFRDIGELLGTLVAWNKQSKTVTMRYPELTVKVPFGSTSASVNGQRVSLSTPLRMVGGRVYVPLRFFSEAIGAEVKWEATTHNVRMTKPKDYLELNPLAIWLNRTTHDLYMGKGEQSDVLSIGKLEAELKGTVSVEGPSRHGKNTVLTLVDSYASPQPHYEVYTLLIRDNQIVEQKHASYDHRYESNASDYQVYDPNGWIQHAVLTDGKIVWIYNDEGKVVLTYDLPELTQQDDVFSVQAVGSDFLVVRPNLSGLLTLIDLKDNSTVVLADKLLSGKDLAYAHDNKTPYPGDSLNFAWDMGHGILDFGYDSPFPNNNGQSERLSYERPSYEEEREALPKERSFQEMASSCSTDTVVSVDIQDGDLIYKPLIGSNKQDQEGIRTVCRILKKITADGVEVTLPRTFPVTFFHGISVNFSADDSVSIYRASGDRLAMGSELGGKNIFLDEDAQIIKEFERLKVLPK